MDHVDPVERGAASAPDVGFRSRTGELLLGRGLITQAQLDHALQVQARSGARLGSILLAMGAVRRLDLFRTLAELWSLPFLDLTDVPLDHDLMRTVPATVMAAEKWVPVRVEDGAVVIASTDRPTPHLQATVTAVFGMMPVRFAVTTEWDVNTALRQVFGATSSTTPSSGCAARRPTSRRHTRWPSGSASRWLRGRSCWSSPPRPHRRPRRWSRWWP